MATTSVEAPGGATVAQRWLARLALVTAAAAVLMPLLVAGFRQLARRTVADGADASQIPVGVDGEALLLDTPVRCTLQPAALRVRVPRDRPGVPDPKPIMDWKRMWRIALTVHRPVRSRPW
jgi:hypothetical protein